MEILFLAFLLASGKFILMCKFLPMKKVLYFDKYIDLFFTIVLPLCLYGTFHGMVLAIFSGLFLSVMLLIAKKVIGCEPPHWIAKRQNKWSR